MELLLGLKMHLAVQEIPSLLLLTALHLADVFCRRNVENFPFHHVRSSGLGLALPQEPSGHSWSRAGPRRIAELGAVAFPWLEGHSGAGLTKANASHGVGEGAQPDAQVKGGGAQRGLCLLL